MGKQNKRDKNDKEITTQKLKSREERKEKRDIILKNSKNFFGVSCDLCRVLYL